ARDGGDTRFAALMPARDGPPLPAATRRRFSTSLAGGRTVVYAGEILDSWMSRAGWWLVQAARLIGGPLPLARNAVGRAPSARARAPRGVTGTPGRGGQLEAGVAARGAALAP